MVFWSADLLLPNHNTWYDGNTHENKQTLNKWIYEGEKWNLCSVLDEAQGLLLTLTEYPELEWTHSGHRV